MCIISFHSNVSSIALCWPSFNVFQLRQHLLHWWLYVTDSLTDSSKLEIGNFTCLTVLAPPLSYSIRWEYLSDQSGHPGGSGHNLHNLNFAKFSILSSASLDGFSVLFKIYFIGDTLPLACLWREVGMGRYHNIITLLLPKSWLHNQSRLFPTFSLFPLFRLSSSNVYYTMPALTLRLKPNWTLF